MAIEAVFGVVLSAIFLGEGLRPLVLVGGAAILAGAVLGRDLATRRAAGGGTSSLRRSRTRVGMATSGGRGKAKYSRHQIHRLRGDAVISSTMQDFPLTTTAIMRHGARVHGSSECVTWTENGPRRGTYAEVVARADLLAGALRAARDLVR